MGKGWIRSGLRSERDILVFLLRWVSSCLCTPFKKIQPNKWTSFESPTGLVRYRVSEEDARPIYNGGGPSEGTWDRVPARTEESQGS